MFASNQSLLKQTQKKATPTLINLPGLVPISNLIPDSSTPLCPDRVLFCYRAVANALQACLEGDYTKFDAHTTTNCCHGISLFTQKIIKKVNKLNTSSILTKLNENIKKNSEDSFFLLPNEVLILAQLYILASIRHFREGKWCTSPKNLSHFGQISKKFSCSLVKKLQNKFSNIVTDSYPSIFNLLNKNSKINGIPINSWGQYIQKEHIKIDKFGRKYAAALYSMQITLGLLIQNQEKIAFVCELQSKSGMSRGVHIQLLRGDGISNFEKLESCFFDKKSVDLEEPVIVFGGCSQSDTLKTSCFRQQIAPWLDNFSALILSCDCFYPQFPRVKDDPNFDNSPIQPKEEGIKKIIELHQKLTGFSAADASIFCLTHIYVASLKQILINKENMSHNLPRLVIPEFITV